MPLRRLDRGAERTLSETSAITRSGTGLARPRAWCAKVSAPSGASCRDEEAAVKLATLCIVSVCALAFAGCTIKGPEVRVKPPIEVTVEKDNDRDGRFCPPGQAKKGKC